MTGEPIRTMTRALDAIRAVQRVQLDATARGLYCSLAARISDRRPYPWPSVETLAADLVITAASVRRARARLVDAGLLEVATSAGGAGRTNRYKVIHPAEAAPKTRAPRTRGFNPRVEHREPARGTSRTRAPRAREKDPFEDPREAPRPPHLRLAAAPPPPAERRRVAEILAAASEYSMRPEMFGSRWRDVLEAIPPEPEPLEDHGT